MQAPDGGSTAVTWYRDVLPIVQDRCQGCHAEQGIAPFPLMTYEEAKVQASSIANAVVTRTMPPWMADDSCYPLADSPRLSDEEIATIVQWNDLGAPAGDPNDAPAPKNPQAGLEWVDATFQPDVPYTPKDAVSDDYRCFILPPAFTKATDVIGFEVIPGTAAEVHHVILATAPEADARAADDAEDGPGWTCYGGIGVDQANVRMLGGWAPGAGATRFPEGTGIRVSSGQVIVMQVHYNLANGAKPDQTTLKLQYAKQAVAKQAIIFPISASPISIPPQSTGYSVTGTFSLGDLSPLLSQATVYGVTPHMHELGREISVRNVTTDQCLVHVPAWDFHWQRPYQFVEPLVIHKDDTIELKCTWDNPTDRTVTWGEGTSDEMCVNFFYVTLP